MSSTSATADLVALAPAKPASSSSTRIMRALPLPASRQASTTARASGSDRGLRRASRGGRSFPRLRAAPCSRTCAGSLLETATVLRRGKRRAARTQRSAAMAASSRRPHPGVRPVEGRCARCAVDGRSARPTGAAAVLPFDAATPANLHQSVASRPLRSLSDLALGWNLAPVNELESILDYLLLRLALASAAAAVVAPSSWCPPSAPRSAHGSETRCCGARLSPPSTSSQPRGRCCAGSCTCWRCAGRAARRSRRRTQAAQARQAAHRRRSVCASASTGRCSRLTVLCGTPEAQTAEESDRSALCAAG